MERIPRKSDLEDMSLSSDLPASSRLTSDLPSRGRRSPVRRSKFSRRLIPPLIIILIGLLGFIITIVNKPDDILSNSNQNFDDLIDRGQETPDVIETPESQFETKTFATVQANDAGFLRVRNQGSTAGRELGRLNVGDKVEVLETKSGWLRVKLNTPLQGASEGWISAQFAATSTEQVQIQ